MGQRNNLFGFDEAAYLRHNPDVAEVIRNEGSFSAWHHYVLHGWREGRPGIPSEPNQQVWKLLRRLDSDSTIPLPAAHLRKRVHGDDDPGAFELIGKLVSADLYRALESASIELDKRSRVLDFGCGCGRVIKYFSKLYDKSELHGSDIDQEAIAWCQEHLSHRAKFGVNAAWPPLPFPNEFFDFVYSISLFTHLPEELQFALLDDLRRITKRHGYLILSVHGRELFESASEAAKETFKNAGFCYSVGSGTEGLPSFYQTSFHNEEYIGKHWSKYFEIKTIIKKGVANLQDLVLCQRTE